MPAPQIPMHRSTPRRLRHVLLYGAGGSIALHLGVFATSPLWWHTVDRPPVSEPVELLMLDGNTIATARPIAATHISEVISDDTTINTPSDPIAPSPLAAIAATPDRPILDPNTNPNHPPVQNFEPDPSTTPTDPDHPETPEPSETPNHPEKNKSKDIQGRNSESGGTEASGETGETVETTETRDGGVGRNAGGEAGGRGGVAGSRRGNGHGSGDGSGRGSGRGAGVRNDRGSGRGSGVGTGDRSTGDRGTSSEQSSSGTATGAASGGGTSCTGGCQGRYQGSQTEAVERDPLIRAYRNANGELEFELVRSSGSTEADRAALATAQQASYSSDQSEFTIRARIAEEGSNTTETTRESVPAQPVTLPQETTPIRSPEPTYEEPVYEEPVYEEPVYEEPVYEEPVYEEPVYEEPVYEEPVYEESTDLVDEEPIYEESSEIEPIIEADEDS